MTGLSYPRLFDSEVFERSADTCLWDGPYSPHDAVFSCMPSKRDAPVP